MGDSYNRVTKTTLTKKKHILTYLNRTLSESDPDDEITQDEFNEARKRRGKDTAPGPDKVRYSDIKNPTEEDRTELYAIYQGNLYKDHIPED